MDSPTAVVNCPYDDGNRMGACRVAISERDVRAVSQSSACSS